MKTAIWTFLIALCFGLGADVAKAQNLELTHPPIPLFLPDNAPINATIYIGPTQITVVNNGQVTTHDTPYHGKLALIASDYSDSITVLGQPLVYLAVGLHDGDDQYIDYTSSPGFVVGGDGNDDITTGDADDLVRAGAGNDIVRTGAGNDTATGDDGDDTIYLGAGDDVAVGGDGDDDLFGEAGNDILSGAHGVDLVDGGPGADDLYGYGPKKYMGNTLAQPSNTINDPPAYPDGKTDMLVGGSGPDVFYDRFWEWKTTGTGRFGYKYYYEIDAISTFQPSEDIRVDSYVPRPKRPVATITSNSYYIRTP